MPEGIAVASAAEARRFSLTEDAHENGGAFTEKRQPHCLTWHFILDNNNAESILGGFLYPV